MGFVHFGTALGACLVASSAWALVAEPTQAPGAGTQVQADSPPAKPAPALRPSWRRKPSAEDFARVYPTAEADAGRGGHATLNCVVDDSGGLSQCVIIEETPPGHGYARAALSLAPLYKLQNAKAGIHIKVPMGWSVAGF